MPRTLPWKIDDKSARNSIAPRPVRRTPTEKGSRKRGFRSRSSSPVIGPPSEEYMVEGFENDDQYVMVEDELLSAAQSFTRHLHQAEYSRRKRLAGIKNAEAVGDLTRPTDPKAQMSTETRKNIESKTSSAKHKAALDQIKDDAGRPPVDSELEDEGDQSEEDDPWMGTQLQSLMTTPRKSRSLVGLQGVKSNTRAAHGFSNATTSHLEDKKARAAAAPEFPDPSGQDEETSSGDDDDLGRPSLHQRSKAAALARNSPTSHSAGSDKRNASEPNRRVPEPDKPSPSVYSNGQRAGVTKTYKSRIGKLFDEFDKEPIMPTVKEEKKSPKRDPAQRVRPAKTKQEPKSNKDRLNQVPTFL